MDSESDKMFITEDLARGVALKISQGGQTPKNVFQGGQTPKKPEKISKTLRISRLLPFFSIFRGGREGRGGQAFTPLANVPPNQI